MKKNINLIKLSVIIPVYNTEEYLMECLDSLVKTNYTSLEIIIINDGSTDNSELIIKEYQKKYSFIKYYSQKNNGQGSARNIGIENAKGKYIYFMDSDDIVSENIFHELIKELDEEKLDAIFFDGSSFHEEKVGENSFFDPRYSRKKSYGLYSEGEKMLFDFIKNREYTVSPCLYIFKKEVINDKKIRFEEKVIHEDELFTLKLFLATRKCKHINKVYFYRRIREGSTMTTFQVEKKYLGYYSVFVGFNEILEQHVFKSKDNRNVFIKMISNIYRKLIVLYRLNDISSEAETFDNIVLFGEKNNYYNILGYIATHHFYIYNKLFEVKKKIKLI